MSTGIAGVFHNALQPAELRLQLSLFLAESCLVGAVLNDLGLE
jgi:hypothetical protein